MQENNFEKQVQQKLDDFQLTPSEPVWQHVEAAIRKKKDRRLVFWFLPFLLLAGGVVWWQATTWHQENVARQAIIKKHSSDEQTFSKPHIEQQTKKWNTPVQALENKQTKTAKPEPVPEPVPKAPAAGIKKDVTQQIAGKERAARNLIVTNGETSSQKAPNDRRPKTNNAAGKQVLNGATVPVASQAQAPVLNNTATGNTDHAINKDTLAQPSNTKRDSVVQTVQQATKNTPAGKRLQWSIVGRIGVSNVVESLTSNFGNKANASANPAMDYSSGGSTANASGSKEPTVPTHDVQFSIGAILKKGVGKKSHLLAGLQYSYYSYNLAVGTQPSPNSLLNLNRYYLQSTFLNNGEQNQFTNTLQFIELPVGFEYQLLKKYPLHVQHGFTISQLLSGKVLQYNYTSNAYYQESNGLRKTGFNFYTSVDYTIWKGKSVSLQAGPHIQYWLQPLYKYTSNSHLLSGGLAVSMAF